MDGYALVNGLGFVFLLAAPLTVQADVGRDAPLPHANARNAPPPYIDPDVCVIVDLERFNPGTLRPQHHRG